jgi:hypothetical protein
MVYPREPIGIRLSLLKSREYVLNCIIDRFNVFLTDQFLVYAFASNTGAAFSVPNTEVVLLFRTGLRLS